MSSTDLGGKEFIAKIHFFKVKERHILGNVTSFRVQFLFRNDTRVPRKPRAK